MRKVVTAIMLSAIMSVAHAESDNNQLFDCMDTKTFEMNSQCMADQIANNMTYREAQSQLIQHASDSSDLVLATMKFYPKQMRIEVIAHKDAALADATQSGNHIAKR